MAALRGSSSLRDVFFIDMNDLVLINNWLDESRVARESRRDRDAPETRCRGARHWHARRQGLSKVIAICGEMT